VFKPTFNNTPVTSILLVEETGENDQPTFLYHKSLTNFIT
jgi:hypothetical protein